MKIASVLLPAILATTASAADRSSEQVVRLISRPAGPNVALSVVVTDRSGVCSATEDPIVVDLVLGDAVVGTIRVDAGGTASRPLTVAASVADRDGLHGRIRIPDTGLYAGRVGPVAATPVSAN